MKIETFGVRCEPFDLVSPECQDVLLKLSQGMTGVQISTHYGNRPSAVEYYKSKIGAIGMDLDRPVNIGEQEMFGARYVILALIQDGVNEGYISVSKEDREKEFPLLSQREEEVMFLICNGATRAEASEYLGIKVNTFDKHKEHIRANYELVKGQSFYLAVVRYAYQKRKAEFLELNPV